MPEQPGVASFMAGLERNVLALEGALRDGSWRPSNYTVIHVRDPKPRLVSAAPFRVYFPGDDLFTPQIRPRGLPIGNLTSQFFANVYLDGFDHFIKEVLRAPGYVRYSDDFALFHDDPAVLAEWRQRLGAYLVGRRLLLHPRKTLIQATSVAAGFLGMVLCRPGLRRLPEANVWRFRNRLRGTRQRWRACTATTTWGSVLPARLFARAALPKGGAGVLAAFNADLGECGARRPGWRVGATVAGSLPELPRWWREHERLFGARRQDGGTRSLL